jgi:hypothetical protein
VLEGGDKTDFTMLVRGNMKTNCSLTDTCNFVGHTNNKPNKRSNAIYKYLKHKYSVG